MSTHDISETTANRVTLAIFLVVLIFGVWLIAKSAAAQTAAPVCQANDSTQTCLALLDQKSGQIDTHLTHTDKNVDDILANLKSLDRDIIEIKNNEAWERAIWGSMVTLLAGGFFVMHFTRRKG